MKNAFDVVNTNPGLGNQKGKFWFVGIEEAGAICKEKLENILTDYAKAERFVMPGEIRNEKSKRREKKKSYTSVYDIMSKIVCQDKDWMKFRDNQLLGSQSNEFQTNLYPLGKRNTKDWPAHYKEIFGYGREDRQAYLDAVCLTRFPLLRKLRTKSKPEWTICFGKTFHKDFVKTFGIEEPYEVNADLFNEGMFLYPQSKFIVTPFFVNHQMGWRRINKVRALIGRNPI